MNKKRAFILRTAKGSIAALQSGGRDDTRGIGDVGQVESKVVQQVVFHPRHRIGRVEIHADHHERFLDFQPK